MDRTPRQYKDSFYQQFARIGKAVSSPKRLELLDILCNGERTVEVLAKEAKMSIGNTSQHLQTLRAAHLVDARKEGLYVTYRLADQEVCEFFLKMRILAENHLAEIKQVTSQFLRGRKGMEPVDRDVLLDRVREGMVTVLDVRPVEEYRAGHIPGAISIPLSQLKSHLAELPKDQEIVAYCRGPYCVLAIQAVELLRAQGFEALRLEEGVQDWRAMGFSVAVG